MPSARILAARAFCSMRARAEQLSDSGIRVGIGSWNQTDNRREGEGPITCAARIFLPSFRASILARRASSAARA